MSKVDRVRTMYLTVSFLSLALLSVPIGGGCLVARTGPSLAGATSWLNTEPIDLKNLRGKVVLIEFWTYTCINWRRALPYTRAWAAKYKDQGLVVIGIHTPEFSFEHKPENVSSAIKEVDLPYPIALDNNYEIWRSFQNQYWPALYVIDKRGKLRYQKFGEGDYAEAELQIQKLLRDGSITKVFDKPVVLQPEGVEAAADWQNLQSPENFLGYERTQGFASPKGAVPDKPTFYSVPKQLKLNEWALSGEWIISRENIRLSKGQGKVIYRFHARDLHLIMSPALLKTSVKFRVLIDGNPPGPSHGLDVDREGNGVVTGQRMYQLIRQEGPIIDREFQIEFIDQEVEVYDFTFG